MIDSVLTHRLKVDFGKRVHRSEMAEVRPAKYFLRLTHERQIADL